MINASRVRGAGDNLAAMSTPPPTYQFPQGPEDWTGGELATIVILAVVYFCDIVLACFLIANRDYRPIRSLQLPLIVTMILGARMPRCHVRPLS